MTHPKHELMRYEKAKRVSYFLHSNDFSSDLMEHAGKRLWITVLKLAGEQVIKVNGQEYEGSEATRALIVEMLRDREASNAPKGPSLAEIEASGARDTSSWGTPAPVTSSDGSTPVQAASRPASSDPSEPVATSPAFRGEGQAAPTTTASAGASTEKTSAVPATTSRSESVADASPTAPASPRGRGGQASLPFQPHSETSRLAAHDEDAKDVAAAHRLLVLQTLRELGPLTDDQIADHLGLTTEQVRIRRIGLMHDGYVAQAGRGVSRKGRACNTWGLADMAVSA